MSGGNLSGIYHSMAVTQQPWYKSYIYHEKSRLNSPVRGSLRSPITSFFLSTFFSFSFSRQNRILSRKQILIYIGRVGPKETDYSA